MRYLMTLSSLLLTTLTVAAEHAEPQPALSDNANWVPIMLIIVGGLFLMAAVIGPIIRANTPEEIPPPAHSHDEPPGASHHHGHGGTIDPAPLDELPPHGH
jgi:hypothetical protein